MWVSSMHSIINNQLFQLALIELSQLSARSDVNSIKLRQLFNLSVSSWVNVPKVTVQVLPSAPQLARPLTPKRVVLLYDTGQRDPVLDRVHLHRPGCGHQRVVGHLRRRAAAKLPARLQAGRRPPDDSEDVEHIGPNVDRLSKFFKFIKFAISDD